MTDWQPGCDAETLEARARMLQDLRAHFDSRGYLEVQTPSLSRSTASDPFLTSFEVTVGDERRYLQTSPEFHMKRLLAVMSRPIYQVCPAFRRAGTGHLHNSEFTILEWYAPGASADEMAEFTCDLIDRLYKPDVLQRTSFEELIKLTLDVDLAARDQSALVEAARGFADHADEQTALDCLYEKALSSLSGRVLVRGFPAALASLAALNKDGSADRFEVIIEGIEIANGCRELLDADGFTQRAAEDADIRRAKDLPQIDCDPRLEAALRSGLSPVSGVALGLDRLLMLKLGKKRISEVLTFSDHNA